jgi:hypothetical protein
LNCFTSNYTTFQMQECLSKALQAELKNNIFTSWSCITTITSQVSQVEEQSFTKVGEHRFTSRNWLNNPTSRMRKKTILQVGQVKWNCKVHLQLSNNLLSNPFSKFKKQHKLELPIKHSDPLQRKQQKSETSHSKFNIQPARIDDKGSVQQIT